MPIVAGPLIITAALVALLGGGGGKKSNGRDPYLVELELPTTIEEFTAFASLMCECGDELPGATAVELSHCLATKIWPAVSWPAQSGDHESVKEAEKLADEAADAYTADSIAYCLAFNPPAPIPPDPQAEWYPFPDLWTLQYALFELGFTIERTGVSDGQTAMTIKRFQEWINTFRPLNLNTTGLADLATREAIADAWGNIGGDGWWQYPPECEDCPGGDPLPWPLPIQPIEPIGPLIPGVIVTTPQTIDWQYIGAMDPGYPWEQPSIHRGPDGNMFPTPGTVYDIDAENSLDDAAPNLLLKTMLGIARSTLATAYAMAGDAKKIDDIPDSAVIAYKNLIVCSPWNDSLYGTTNASQAGGSMGMGPHGRGIQMQPVHRANVQRVSNNLNPTAPTRTRFLNGAQNSQIPDDNLRPQLWLPPIDLAMLASSNIVTTEGMTWSDGDSVLMPPPKLAIHGVLSAVAPGGGKWGCS